MIRLQIERPSPDPCALPWVVKASNNCPATSDATPGPVTEIEDTGPGVASEVAGQLFEAFTTHGKAHGSGLGLSICKRIIEDHHGWIATRNEPGRGAILD